MHRIGNNRGAGAKLTLYVLAGTASGLVAGAALGAIGGLLSPDTRAAIATVLALGAMGVGILELAGRRLRLIEVDRETPYVWLRQGPLSWAIRNGATIGLGARTRIGFWLWYVIPAGALVGGSPLLGALGYGLYGLTRTLGAGGLFVLGRSGRATGLEILRQSNRARSIASAQLLVVGLASFIILGF